MARARKPGPLRRDRCSKQWSKSCDRGPVLLTAISGARAEQSCYARAPLITVDRHAQAMQYAYACADRQRAPFTNVQSENRLGLWNRTSVLSRGCGETPRPIAACQPFDREPASLSRAPNAATSSRRPFTRPRQYACPTHNLHDIPPQSAKPFTSLLHYADCHSSPKSGLCEPQLGARCEPPAERERTTSSETIARSDEPYCMGPIGQHKGAEYADSPFHETVPARFSN